MTEPEDDGASVVGAPSEAGSLAESDDSDFELQVSSVPSSDSSSDEDELPLESQDLPGLQLDDGEDGDQHLPEVEEVLDDADMVSSDEELGTEADEPTQTQNSTAHADGEAVDSQLQSAAPAPGEQSAAQPSNEQAAPQEQHHSSVVNTAGEALAADSACEGREDAVARRTRAQQSLIDCSLEELEALLQLDAEDAAAKEDAEYEAFIQSVLTKSPEPATLPDEDEDDDDDFVLDLNEMLADATQEDAEQQGRVLQTRLRSQQGQAVQQQQPAGPFTQGQLATLHQQINQHTQLLMQMYARTSASIYHQHPATVSRALLFGLVQRRDQQLVTRQAQAIPPLQLSSMPPGMSQPQAGLQSIMDAPLLRFAPGFLAEMDTALHLPRPLPPPQAPRAYGLPSPPAPPPPAVHSVLDRYAGMMDRSLISETRVVHMAKDGSAWSEADDALLAMGLLKWGAINDTIAADLLPGYTGNSVGQRVADCTHRQQPPNTVKSAFETIRGPLLEHEVELICRGVRECPLNAQGNIQWPVISRLLMRYRTALLLAKLWSDLCAQQGGMPVEPGSAVTAEFAVVAAEMQQEAAAAAAAAAQAAAAAAAAAYERKKAKQRARRENLLKNAAAAQSAAAHSQQPAVPAASPCGQTPVQQLPTVAGRGAGRGSRPRGRGRGTAQQAQQQQQQQTSPGPPTSAAKGRGRGRGRGGRGGASAASAPGPTLAAADQQQTAQLRQPPARAVPQRPVPAAVPASLVASMPTQGASGAAPPQGPPCPGAVMPTSPAGLQQPGSGAIAAHQPTQLPSAASPAQPRSTEGACLQPPPTFAAATSRRQALTAMAAMMHTPPCATAAPAPAASDASESMSEGDEEYQPPAAAAAAAAAAAKLPPRNPAAAAARTSQAPDPAAQAAAQAALQRAAGASQRRQPAWMTSAAALAAEKAAAAKAAADRALQSECAAPRPAAAQGTPPRRQPLGGGRRSPCAAAIDAVSSPAGQAPSPGPWQRMLDAFPSPGPLGRAHAPSQAAIASSAATRQLDFGQRRNQQHGGPDMAAQNLLRLRGADAPGVMTAAAAGSTQARQQRQQAASKPRQAPKRPRRNPVPPPKTLSTFEHEALPVSDSDAEAAPFADGSGGGSGSTGAPDPAAAARQAAAANEGQAGQAAGAAPPWQSGAGALPQFDREALPVSSSDDEGPAAWQPRGRSGQAAPAVVGLAADDAAAALILNELSNDRSMPLDAPLPAAGPGGQRGPSIGNGKIVFDRDAFEDSDSGGTMTDSEVGAAEAAVGGGRGGSLGAAGSAPQPAAVGAGRQQPQRRQRSAPAQAHRKRPAAKAAGKRKPLAGRAAPAKRRSPAPVLSAATALMAPAAAAACAAAAEPPPSATPAVDVRRSPRKQLQNGRPAPSQVSNGDPALAGQPTAASAPQHGPVPASTAPVAAPHATAQPAAAAQPPAPASDQRAVCQPGFQPSASQPPGQAAAPQVVALPPAAAGNGTPQMLPQPRPAVGAARHAPPPPVPQANGLVGLPAPAAAAARAAPSAAQPQQAGQLAAAQANGEAGSAAPRLVAAGTAASAVDAQPPTRVWSMADDRAIMKDLMVPFKGKAPPAEALQRSAAELAAGGAPCRAPQVAQRLEYLLNEFRKRKKG